MAGRLIDIGHLLLVLHLNIRTSRLPITSTATKNRLADNRILEYFEDSVDEVFIFGENRSFLAVIWGFSVMADIVQPYALTLWCVLTTGGLLLVQLLVADVVGLLNGHVPGAALPAAHDNFHFRATRAHANTNESIAAFLLFVVACVALGAAPGWVNNLSLAYCLARVAHMLFYWLGLGPLRSLAFIVSLVALLGLAIVGFGAALS